MSKPGILDHASANLRTAFLDCFLVPVPRATDLAGFAVPAATEAATPAFQSKLTVSNVGVVMGCRSAGLLAMTFSHRAGLDAFLERNPASSNSLVTEHAGEPVLWHKADTNYRLSRDLPGCHVQMTGVRIVFRRDDIRRPDMFLARAVPTQVSPELLT